MGSAPAIEVKALRAGMHQGVQPLVYCSDSRYIGGAGRQVTVLVMTVFFGNETVKTYISTIVGFVFV